MLPMSGDVALELSVGLSDFTSISAQNHTPAAFSRSHAGSILTVVETDGVPLMVYAGDPREVQLRKSIRGEVSCLQQKAMEYTIHCRCRRQQFEIRGS